MQNPEAYSKWAKDKKKYNQLKNFFRNLFGSESNIKLEKTEQQFIQAVKTEQLEKQYIKDIDPIV